MERVVAFDYIPSTDDVLRARLETQGVEEHHLKIESGQSTLPQTSTSLDHVLHSLCSIGLNAREDWVVYDVGGARRLRR